MSEAPNTDPSDPEAAPGKLVASDAEELAQLVDESFRNAPPNAEYIQREISFGPPGDERRLLVIREIAPGVPPGKEREVFIEAREGPEDSTLEPPEEPGQGEIDYNVAVSFAGEDRDYVEQVVRRLLDEGVRVFYDREEQARLWGRNLLEELVATYRERAFRTLMFVSASYAEKAWPTEERRAAQDRAMQTVNEPYILPVRLDGTPLPGLHETTAWVDGRTLTAVEVADLVIEHLREHGRDVGPPPAQRDMAQRVGIQATPGRTPSGKWEVPYKIYNGSEYPIHNAVLVIDDPGQEGRAEEQMGTAIEVVIGNVNPGETIEDRTEVKFQQEPIFGQLTHLAALLFSDHWGSHWASTGREVTRLKYAPRVC